MPSKSEPRKWARVAPGKLYGWHKDMPQAKRWTLISRAVKRDSYATIVRRLNQLRNLTKDRGTKAIAAKDMAYLKKKFKK
ncbi:hypothetical protein HY488_02270 [Candidatus Woesearchaeota archaeon]|nr:hypothetical protein [Candidatus Woesearchaeota archaeon]